MLHYYKEDMTPHHRRCCAHSAVVMLLEVMQVNLCTLCTSDDENRLCGASLRENHKISTGIYERLCSWYTIAAYVSQSDHVISHEYSGLSI